MTTYSLFRSVCLRAPATDGGSVADILPAFRAGQPAGRTGHPVALLKTTRPGEVSR